MEKYAYWRDSKGNPSRLSKDSPRILLAEYGESSTLNGTSLEWKGFRSHHFLPAIQLSCMVIGRRKVPMNPDDAWGLFRKAIHEIIREGGGGVAPEPEAILMRVDRKAIEFYKQPHSMYELVTSLSIPAPPSRRIKVADNTLVFSNRFPRGFVLPEQIENGAAFGCPFRSHILSSKYQKVRVQGKGRSSHEAYYSLVRATEIFRGLMNLFLTRGSYNFSFGLSTEVKPIGVVHNGPLHLLYKFADGVRIPDVIWHVPGQVSDRELAKIQPENWLILEKNRRWAHRRLAKSPFKDDLEDIIIGYARALDQTSFDHAFLQMWSLLEKITDNQPGGSYDLTIKRATRIFGPDRAMTKEVLQALRLYRNRFVHKADSVDDGKDAAYIVKKFVEPHILDLLRNKYLVSSLKEYGEICSLPYDPEVLKKRRKHLATAINSIKKE